MEDTWARKIGELYVLSNFPINLELCQNKKVVDKITNQSIIIVQSSIWHSISEAGIHLKSDTKANPCLKELAFNCICKKTCYKLRNSLFFLGFIFFFLQKKKYMFKCLLFNQSLRFISLVGGRQNGQQGLI